MTCSTSVILPPTSVGITSELLSFDSRIFSETKTFTQRSPVKLPRVYFNPTPIPRILGIRWSGWGSAARFPSARGLGSGAGAHPGPGTSRLPGSSVSNVGTACATAVLRARRGALGSNWLSLVTALAGVRPRHSGWN